MVFACVWIKQNVRTSWRNQSFSMTKLSPNVLIYLAIVGIGLDPSYGQSLARNKTVTLSQLNTIGRWADELGVVDGNYDRNASACRCCADSGRGVDPWIEIDLGETNSFTRIVVYGRTDFDSSINNLANVAVELDGELDSVSPTLYSSDPYLLHINFERTMLAQRIKLISRGNDKRLVLCEVDVFSDSVISTRKNMTAVSIYDKWQPSNAVDGLIRTNDPQTCICCAATERQTDPWLRLDLGDVLFITFMQLYGRTDGIHNGQSFEGMRIDVDDITIHTIPTSGTHINYYEMFPTPERIGRYIKLTLSGDNKVIIICEMVVHGERVISTKKGAIQISRFNVWEASRAVDGNYVTDDPDGCRCCSATLHDTNPWLEVNLGPNHKISRIVIYGRTNAQFLGQSFANMSIQLDSTMLQTIPEPDPVYWVNFYGFQLTSAQIGQIVKITLLGPDEQLVVCELVVYGDCVDGYFGENCDNQCHCKGELCNNLTGICPSGICEAGYKGDTCSEQCNSYNYGENCEENCGECRNREVCNLFNGFCNDCEDGYALADKTCKTRCTPGRYGYNCSNSCGQCRDNKPCNIATGKCDVCADGYIFADTLCKTMCSDGTYGTGCVDLCGNCRYGEVCNKIDGRCIECEDGYVETDLTCKTKCPNGTYGQNCAQRCGACKDDATCHFTNGLCEDCLPGFYLTDKLCKTVCRLTHGYNCTISCGFCKDNNSCNPIDGTCDRCEAGYTQSDCKAECQKGEFGHNCEQRCGMCKDNFFCDKKTGICPNGCSDGFHGDKCLQPSAQEETGISVPVYAGSMAAVGLVLVLCIALFSVYLCRRSKQRKNTDRNEVPAPPQQDPAETSNYESLDMTLAGEEKNYSGLKI